MEIYDRVLQEFSLQASKKDKTIFQKISSMYRSNDGSGRASIKNFDDAVVYGVCRMPATMGAIKKCFENINFQEVGSVADVGSGTGAGLLALVDVNFKGDYLAIEKFDAMKNAFEITRNILNGYENIPSVSLTQTDLLELNCEQTYDLVMANYALNEINEKDKERAFKKLLDLSNRYILVIEAGTPAGYNDILNYKNSCLQLGYNVVAPCKFKVGCPLPKDDWCHFVARVNRPSMVSQFKDCDRNFEDEKFIYLIVDKMSAENSTVGKRIIKRPRQSKGNISFECCTCGGIEVQVFSKRDGERYKNSKKLGVGDCL